MKIVKILSFCGPRGRHISKFGESDQIIFSVKVSKNFFSQIYGQNFGKKRSLKVSKIISVRLMNRNLVKMVINGVNVVKIGHFW